MSLGAAAILAPIAAAVLATTGFHFPFPRIFDRAAMIAGAGGLILFARPLRLRDSVRDGLQEPRANVSYFLAGLVAALVIMGLLFAVAVISGSLSVSAGGVLFRAIRFAAPALLIGFIEELFFRAILLGGLARSSGKVAALIISSVFYALVHIVRSPHHYYLSAYYPLAGFENIVGGFDRLTHPSIALPILLGLFLLGIALGEAYLLTGQLYASIGLHAGFVIGAKCWPLIAESGRHFPQWLVGPGPIPLVAAPAAWIAAILLILVMAIAWNPPKTAEDQPRLRYTS